MSSAESLDYILAHDLANYLTIIQGNAELLLDDVDDPDMVARLNTIQRQTTAANTLLQTVSGITRGGAQHEFEAVEVSSLLTSELGRLQTAYPDTTISTNIDGQITARADDLLLSVFANLLENAMQHNDSTQPTVSVTARTQDGKVVVSIEDNGPGIPARVRDQLLGRDLAHPSSGTHIIRSLVERYGGRITADRNEGGSKVTVELPPAQE